MDSIKKLKPDIVFFAYTEPLPNIREICKAIREISKVQTKSQLLLLGNIPSHEEIVSLMNAGARGYFDLNDPADQLPEAIRIIGKGEIWLPRDKMSSIMDRIISVVGRDLKEKTLDQLASRTPIYRKLPYYGKFPYAKPILYYWERQMIKKHLEHLETIGKVKNLSNSRFVRVR